MSLEAIARAWMASSHWGGWRVGMAFAGERLAGDTQCVSWQGAADALNAHPDGSIPDLSHVGTLAFLLEDVRKAIGDPLAYVEAHIDARDEQIRRRVYSPSCLVVLDPVAQTEAEALHAALAAAPEAA